MKPLSRSQIVCFWVVYLTSPLILFGALVLSALCITGCAPKGEIKSRGKIDKVDKIVMSDADHFTVLWQEGEMIRSKNFLRSNTTIKADVPEGQPMYVTYYRKHGDYYDYAEFHVHSSDDIQK